MTVRGRRQVGKSRLAQEFCDRAGVPYLFSTATKGASPVEAVTWFLDDLRESALPTEHELVPELGRGSWPDAFRALAAVLPQTPCVVVLDELPWLAEQDSLFDGALQTAWDRLLAAKPVLLLLLGSDLHMMERLTAYDRPFFGRALGLRAADAIDAHLISGGLPGSVRTWPHAMPALTFLREESADPAAAVFGVPESALLAEFPTPDVARRVLEAVGAGDRTHANIATTAGGREGGLPSGTLSPLLRVVHEQVRRGRPDAGFRVVERRWTAWRGRAVEPLVRQSLEVAALSGRLPWPDVEAVGGWWNRQFAPEIDLVGADRVPVAKRIFFAGSIKWLARPFDRHDLTTVRRAVTHVPGYDPATTGLVVASLSGLGKDIDERSVDLLWTPKDVIQSWLA